MKTTAALLRDITGVITDAAYRQGQLEVEVKPETLADLKNILLGLPMDGDIQWALDEIAHLEEQWQYHKQPSPS